MAFITRSFSRPIVPITIWGWFFSNFDYRKLPKWTILFEKFSLKLDPEDLFTFVEGNLFVLIASSPNRNLFHFGYPILNKFITIIDNNKKEIGFINHQGI